MKKLILATILAAMLPFTVMAQEDELYFTPKKTVKAVAESKAEPVDVFAGSSRDVDEYNRRGLRSYYQKIGSDSLGNDIIEFHVGDGQYPADTLYVYPGTEQYDDADDYAYSRRMSRFDDWYYYDPYFYRSYWHSPYWYSRWGWYDPWYAGWYDPWYYDWYYPYYRPYSWYGGWGGYYHGWYGGWGGWAVPHHITASHRTGVGYNSWQGRTTRRGAYPVAGSSAGSSSRPSSIGSNRGSYGNSRTTQRSGSSIWGGQSRPSTSSSSQSRSYSPSYNSGASRSTGSFGGGSRSGGGSVGGGGGSRSGGGFGGHR